MKLWIQLSDHIDTLRNQFSDNYLYNKFFDQAQEVMIKGTTKHMSMSLHMEVIEFLNPSNKRDYEDLVSITDKLISMAEYYFQELGLEAVSVKSKISKMNGQMAGFLLGGGLWEQNSEEDIVHYWTRQVFRAPELARLALLACAPHPTEAFVERGFSHQGLICNDLRGSLSEESVKALMKVRFNYLSLFSEPSPLDPDILLC